MTVFQSKVEAMSFYDESSFAADYSASYASFAPIPFNEGTAVVSLMNPVESPLHAQQRIDGYPLGVLMPKSATLDFTCNLETATTKATSTVASTHTWLTQLLAHALGSYQVSTGTTASAGWDTSTGDASVVTTLRPGSAIGTVYSTTGAFEARELQTKSGSTLLTKLAFSEAPSTSETLYGCTSVFAGTRDTGYAPSAQFLVQGWNTEDRWLLMGGALDSVTFSFNPGEIPRVTFKWKFAQWFQADGSNTAQDFTGSVLAASTYVDTNTLVVVDSEFRVQTVGTATLANTLYQPSQIEITLPGLTHVPHRSPGGTQTINGWVRTHTPPLARGSFTLPYEDSQTWFAARDARTAKLISYQIGTDISVGAVLFSAPNVQIVDVQRVDLDGIQGQKVDWVSRLENDATAETSYEPIAESAFRIHFF